MALLNCRDVIIMVLLVPATWGRPPYPYITLRGHHITIQEAGQEKQQFSNTMLMCGCADRAGGGLGYANILASPHTHILILSYFTSSVKDLVSM
jgi:hypothetical protein